jgi:hypothetical protein
MSLVVCSNQKLDAEDYRQDGSIFKPYSFRNSLSSMYKIPKNAQVALQSVKYALNGTIALSTNGRIMYQYFGEDLDGTSAIKSMNNNSTVVPIRTPLVDTFEAEDIENGSYAAQQNKIRNYTVNEFARAFQSSLNNYIYHPNLMGNVSVNVNRDTDNKFIGFKINYNLPATTTDAAPADGFAQDLSSPQVRDGELTQAWTYSGGVFTVNDPNDRGTPQAAILTEKPISANDGHLTVNFSNANASGKEWAVGLSRFVQEEDRTGDLIQPSFFSLRKSGDQRPTKKIGFYDYLVCRKGNLLKVYHTPYDSGNGDDGLICSRELALNATVAQDYDLDTNETAYHSVKFTVSGQKIKIQLVHAGAHDTVYEYDAAQTNAQQLKATCISTWQLFPVLYIDSPNAGLSNELTVTGFIGCDMPSNWTVEADDGDYSGRFASWYDSVEDSNNIQIAQQVETRPWNDQATVGRANLITYSGITDGLFDQYDNFLIMKPSEVYAPSSGANSEEFLGFTGESPTNSSVIDESVTTQKIFTSSSIPQMLSNKSIFVKLNNFTQQSINALQGNQSAILSHVPRFDGQVQVGRMYYEPNNLIYLDLNNSNELNVNSFDISLVYSNEQYVEELTGQTIVCLHFRQKPN